MRGGAQMGSRWGIWRQFDAFRCICWVGASGTLLKRSCLCISDGDRPVTKSTPGKPTLHSEFHKTIMMMISEDTSTFQKKKKRKASRGRNRTWVPRVMKLTSIRLPHSDTIERLDFGLWLRHGRKLCVLTIFLLRREFWFFVLFTFIVFCRWCLHSNMVKVGSNWNEILMVRVNWNVCWNSTPCERMFTTCYSLL